MGFGIALSGGGIRGAAHVGVLLALEEAGLKPRSVAGSSAGGMVAGLYAAGISVQQLQKLVLRLAKTGPRLLDPDISGILTLAPKIFTSKCDALSGLLKGDKMEGWLRELTQAKKIAECKLKTVIPAVDLKTAKTVAFTNLRECPRDLPEVRWVNDADLSEVIRATSAVPAVFRPKKLENMLLVDGGVANVLPVSLLLAAGEPNVLAVDVSGAYETPKCYNMMEIAFHSLDIMGSRLRECLTQGEKLFLNPRLPRTDGLLAFEQMPECMEAGYRYTRRILPRLKEIFTP